MPLGRLVQKYDLFLNLRIGIPQSFNECLPKRSKSSISVLEWCFHCFYRPYLPPREADLRDIAPLYMLKSHLPLADNPNCTTNYNKCYIMGNRMGSNEVHVICRVDCSTLTKIHSKELNIVITPPKNYVILLTHNFCCRCLTALRIASLKVKSVRLTPILL